MEPLKESKRVSEAQQWEEVKMNDNEIYNNEILKWLYNWSRSELIIRELKESGHIISDVYIVTEYVASISAHQLYKMADVDGEISGEDLCAAVLANPNTSVFTWETFNNEISANAHCDKFTINKQRNVYEITFRTVGKIMLAWKEGEPSPFLPNDCPEDDEMGVVRCHREWRRYWVRDMTQVSTSLPQYISKEQWQKR